MAQTGGINYYKTPHDVADNKKISRPTDPLTKSVAKLLENANGKWKISIDARAASFFCVYYAAVNV